MAARDDPAIRSADHAPLASRRSTMWLRMLVAVSLLLVAGGETLGAQGHVDIEDRQQLLVDALASEISRLGSGMTVAFASDQLANASQVASQLGVPLRAKEEVLECQGTHCRFRPPFEAYLVFHSFDVTDGEAEAWLTVHRPEGPGVHYQAIRLRLEPAGAGGGWRVKERTIAASS